MAKLEDQLSKHFQTFLKSVLTEKLLALIAFAVQLCNYHSEKVPDMDLMCPIVI